MVERGMMMEVGNKCVCVCVRVRVCVQTTHLHSFSNEMLT